MREEELTEEKMKEIMSRPIDVERLEKELRVMDMNGERWEGKRRREEGGGREEREEREGRY